jgi:hypothetical protein
VGSSAELQGAGLWFEAAFSGGDSGRLEGESKCGVWPALDAAAYAFGGALLDGQPIEERQASHARFSVTCEHQPWSDRQAETVFATILSICRAR